MEELPQLPVSPLPFGHSCAALPSTGVRLDLDQPLKPFQGFVVAGGSGGSRTGSSVITLLPDAKTWTYHSSLPRSLGSAVASMLKGTLRLIGGYSGSRRSEAIFAFLLTNDLMLYRCSSTVLHRGTSG